MIFLGIFRAFFNHFLLNTTEFCYELVSLMVHMLHLPCALMHYRAVGGSQLGPGSFDGISAAFDGHYNPLFTAISEALRAFRNFTDLGHQEKTRLVELRHFKYVFDCEQSEKGESARGPALWKVPGWYSVLSSMNKDGLRVCWSTLACLVCWSPAPCMICMACGGIRCTKNTANASTSWRASSLVAPGPNNANFSSLPQSLLWVETGQRGLLYQACFEQVVFWATYIVTCYYIFTS